VEGLGFPKKGEDVKMSSSNLGFYVNVILKEISKRVWGGCVVPSKSAITKYLKEINYQLICMHFFPFYKNIFAI
jgi:hypothetical protein